ncbi:MAG: hypothetical protein LBI03_06980 [Clostridiales bacterium]|jgi:hypothetical protein|nr:hypothetical protein [Clostridiales bacterium]
MTANGFGQIFFNRVGYIEADSEDEFNGKVEAIKSKLRPNEQIEITKKILYGLAITS